MFNYPAPNEKRMRKKLIFVLGSQRSGTNALRRSLSLDPNVMGFNEAKKNDLFRDWRLRPELEIRDFILTKSSTILLKPINNLKQLPVSAFLDEFNLYDFKVAWIYRDPVNVFSSRIKRWSYLDDVENFVTEWNRINRSVTEVNRSKVRIVAYEELGPGLGVFEKLCRFLAIKGENLFRSNNNSGYSYLEDATIDQIKSGTRKTLAAIEKLKISP